jgi:uncharacterized membrane protein YphA (DoxX/SURF4 family)
MFFRVDYAMSVLFVGFVAGLVLSPATKNLSAGRLGRRYYTAVFIVLLLRISISVYAILVGGANTVGGFLGDVLALLFAGLFGVAARRIDTREFLTESSVFDALFMTLAFTFSLAGVGKMFSLTPMTEFFTQSGYSVTFLKFIIVAEIFGSLGLLLPWTRPLALCGLTVDMFGAVLTHIHNGDPLNDSTGAIGLLIRLIAVGFLWELHRRNEKASSAIRSTILAVTAVSAACLLLALVGGFGVRRLSPPISSVVAPASTR